MPAVAGVKGLALAVRGIDADGGTGVSACVFRHEASARALADGPLLARLRSHPRVGRVDVAAVGGALRAGGALEAALA